jgi:uncharacterized membrane protein
MRKIYKHVKTNIFRGVLALIPLVLSYFVLRFIYLTVDIPLTQLIEKLIGFRIPGLGTVLLLVILYLVGLVAGNWTGKKAFGLIERVSDRIPVVKSIYHLGKQLADALGIPEKGAFKRVVLVEPFRPGLWSVGFVTGEILDKRSGTKLLKLFIPTAPNVTTGFVVALKEDEVRAVPWTIQEAMNAVISGGIIGPEEIE